MSCAEGSASVEMLGMTAPTILRPNASREVAERVVVGDELAVLRRDLVDDRLHLRLRLVELRLVGGRVGVVGRFVARIGAAERGGDVVDHDLVVGRVVPDVRVVDRLAVLVALARRDALGDGHHISALVRGERAVQPVVQADAVAQDEVGRSRSW